MAYSRWYRSAMTFSLSNKTRALSRSVHLKSSFTDVLGDLGKDSVILKSASHDVFDNLALEDWIHDHVDLQKRSLLLLWRNSPVVVIGRHQNPWQECDLPTLRRLGIPLARRRSGGGTVFHDFGNLNMSFFTCKKKYDRPRNLSVVIGALKHLSPSLDVTATDRFDILLNGHYKISGTAAKIGRSSAYHHCTLLCSVNRSMLSSVLRSRIHHAITSNATPSVPSPVRNLVDVDGALDPEAILEAVGEQYNREFGFDCPVVTIDPTDETVLPGVQKMSRALRSWEWVYGRTPKFNVSVGLVVDGVDVHVDADVKNGLVERCVLRIPAHWLPPETVEAITSTLIGCKFCPDETAVLLAAFTRTHPSTADVLEKIHKLYEGLVSVM